MTESNGKPTLADDLRKLEIHRSVGWRPVSAAPVMRPDNAVVGRIGPVDRDGAGIAAVNARLPKNHQEALIEARFANRFDGLMLLDVYIDPAKLPKAPDKHKQGLGDETANQKDDLLRQEAINGIVEACGDIAKSLFHHNHFFHGRRSGNDIKLSKGHLVWLWGIRAILFAVMITAFLQWDKVREWGPRDVWILPLFGVDLGPFDKQAIAPIWSTVGWVVLIILIGEITWWTKLERLWNNRNFNFNGVSFFVRTDRASLGATADAPSPKQPLIEIPTDQPRIGWLTDNWLASQHTLKIDSEHQKDRLAIIQLRRCYLKLIETVSHQINQSHLLERPPLYQFLLPRALWRGFTILFVSFIALLIGGVLGEVWVSGPFTLFLLALAMFCLAVLAHSLLLSSTSVYFRIQHLHNVRGFFSYANAFGSVIEQVMRYGATQDPAHRPRDPASPAQTPTDAFRVDSFVSSADIIQVMINSEEHTMRTLHFRAAVAAAVLALVTPTLFDRLTAPASTAGSIDAPTRKTRVAADQATSFEMNTPVSVRASPAPTDAASQPP